MRKYIISSLFVFGFFSCSEKEKKTEHIRVIDTTKVEPQKNDFKKFIKNSNDKGFRLLCGYDVMNFYFITDSTAVFDLGIFQGWKTPGKDFKDTIKITNLEEIIQLNKDENSAIIDFKSTTNLSTTIHLEIRYNPKYTDVLNAANGNVAIKEVNYACKDLWYK